MNTLTDPAGFPYSVTKPMKTLKQIMEKFDEKFVINVFGYPKAEEIKVFLSQSIKDALEANRNSIKNIDTNPCCNAVLTQYDENVKKFLGEL